MSAFQDAGREIEKKEFADTQEELEIKSDLERDKTAAVYVIDSNGEVDSSEEFKPGSYLDDAGDSPQVVIGCLESDLEQAMEVAKSPEVHSLVMSIVDFLKDQKIEAELGAVVVKVDPFGEGVILKFPIPKLPISVTVSITPDFSK